MSLATTLTNILIDGNSTDNGFFTIDGYASTQYNYGEILSISGDYIITNNTFAGIDDNASLPIINIGATGSNIITQNKFIRGSNTILAYINNNSVSDQVIVNNIFDHSTTDGSNEDLVAGLLISPNSIYKENKNQTGFVFFSFSELASGLVDTDTSPSTVLPVIGNGTSSFSSRINSLDGSGTHTILGSVSGILNDHVPDNVQLLYLASSVSLNFPLGNYVSGTVRFYIYPIISTSFSIASPPTSFAGSIVDQSGGGGTGTVVNSNILTLNTGISTSQYVYADLSGSSIYTTSNNHFYLAYSLAITSGSGDQIGILSSPVCIKYRW